MAQFKLSKLELRQGSKILVGNGRGVRNHSTMEPRATRTLNRRGLDTAKTDADWAQRTIANVHRPHSERQRTCTGLDT